MKTIESALEHINSLKNKIDDQFSVDIYHNDLAIDTNEQFVVKIRVTKIEDLLDLKPTREFLFNPTCPHTDTHFRNDNVVDGLLDCISFLEKRYV